ncbi:MAG: outer membrane lipoprotein-sorting protein [Verrucomicrobia bacterium]|nr:outer membrane lipoprotein-sorting protein [Verrucomicrobiota bacterium]
MKPIILVATLIVASIPSLADPDADEPDGARILQFVIAGLPRERLEIAGDLMVRKRRGVPVHLLQFDMSLNWGASPAEAQYTIRDGFGAPMERFTVTRSLGEAERHRFETGDPLTETNFPGLFEAVQNTDFTWTDLTFSFLWWDGARLVGSEDVKGRDCYMVEVLAPAMDALAKSFAPGAILPCDHMRLWIDKESHVLMMAEARDRTNAPIRRMWVRSFKKINDKWMIKDMEIQAFPPEQRTKMTIREVKTAPPT